jgi:hypothetical protein
VASPVTFYNLEQIAKSEEKPSIIIVGGLKYTGNVETLRKRYLLENVYRVVTALAGPTKLLEPRFGNFCHLGPFQPQFGLFQNLISYSICKSRSIQENSLEF